MNLSAPFIFRPVMTILVTLALVFFGGFAYTLLPVSDLPNIDFPTLQVRASLPGASPETMAATVATTLERQFSAIDGLDSMTSTSTLGSTQITLQFKLDRNIDAAAQDVQTAIAAASGQLPPGMPAPPTARKVNPADFPVLFLSLNSPTLPVSTVNEFAETLVAQQISTVSGVAQVNVFGQQKYAVRAQVDPQRLAARGISFDEVASAIQQGNSNLPVGTLQGDKQAFTLHTNGQLKEAEAYRELIVAYRDGQPVRLKELGRVIDGVENDKMAGWFNGRRGVVLAIQRQPGSNTIAVVDSILKLLPSIQAMLPASVNLEVMFNRAEPIRESVDDVQHTLLITAVLVILIIFLFLRNLRATLVPAIALPISLIGTFAGMYLLGFNLDNISLLALTLATGFVVDDAIVMLENIIRHLEEGKPPLQAALDGAKEIGFTIAAMTISLVAVFIPVLFMSGVVGRLFREFAVTISLAILLSGFVSLTLSPMLCARLLGSGAPHASEKGVYGWLESLFQLSLRAYDVTLQAVLRHRFATLVASFALVGVTGWLFTVVPTGFIPSEDINQIYGSTEAAQDISFEDLKRRQMAVNEIIMADPNVAAVVSTAGAGGRNATGNAGSFVIRLKPRSERSLSADQVVESLRPKLATVPGIKTFLQNPPVIRLGGMISKSPYQLSLKGTDTADLYRVTPLLEAKMREMPQLVDVTSDLYMRSPEVTVDIDRDKASALGITAQQIESTLGSAYGDRYVSQIYADTNAYRVILEVLPEFKSGPTDLSALYVRSATGALVPLSTVATLRQQVGPVQVNHLQQFPATTISFGLAPGVSLGQATAELEKLMARELPSTVSASFQGTAQVFQESLQGLGWLLVLAVVVIYLVLGILYESFIHPVTILSGLPTAGLGALVTLLLFGKELNVFGFVGLIMLIGIVKKNAIMMVDFALEEQRAGKPADAAIYEACKVRFRPIMMTTMAALMGTLPIAFGWGAGAESRQTLGLAVVGGLVVSQLLTLYITPVVYIYLDKLTGRKHKAAGMPPAALLETAP